MGGSSLNPGDGDGIITSKGCGGIFEFRVLVNVEESLFFFDFEIGQEVEIILSMGKLPKLEVIRSKDNLLIGIVPPSYSGLVKCLANGWEYIGEIVKIKGTELEPKIYVRVKGEKQ